MMLEIVLVSVMVLLALLWQIFKKPAGLPPGRWGLPVIGYVPMGIGSISEHLLDLHKKHGDIYLWKLGTRVMVFLHDYHLCREAFTRNEFVDRPDWKVFAFMEHPCLGVFASNGLIWRNNRHFSLRQLKDLGMGKSRLVEAVQKQALRLVEHFKTQAGKPAPVSHALSVFVVNVIWQMVAGKDFEMTDNKLKEFEATLESLMDVVSVMAIPDFFPWLKCFLPGFLRKQLFKEDLLLKSKKKFLKFFFEEMEEHKAKLDRNNPRDLIDGYLIEIEDRKKDPESTFSERNLAFLTFDLFVTGSETMTSTLTWMLYYLATYPEVQQKVQAEIDQVLPKGTLATLQDKSRLPYTDAFLHEVLRKSSQTYVGVPHLTVSDTRLGGYNIPKGTVVASAAAAIHHDPRYWDHPDEFQPERWLDSEGKFVSKKEGFLPFGIGKRMCLAESLGRTEMLIFSTVMLQTLSISCVPGKLLDLRPDPKNPFFHFSRKQELIITVRE
nr:cytochrome P450 2L1-like [Cherax quadricarinatus]